SPYAPPTSVGGFSYILRKRSGDAAPCRSGLEDLREPVAFDGVDDVRAADDAERAIDAVDVDAGPALRLGRRDLVRLARRRFDQRVGLALVRRDIRDDLAGHALAGDGGDRAALAADAELAAIDALDVERDVPARGRIGEGDLLETGQDDG